MKNWDRAQTSTDYDSLDAAINAYLVGRGSDPKYHDQVRDLFESVSRLIPPAASAPMPVHEFTAGSWLPKLNWADGGFAEVMAAFLFATLALVVVLAVIG